MNFTLLSHGDSKDVFILGGTDDIQVSDRQNLSNVCCNTLVVLFFCTSDCLCLFPVKVLLDDSIINVGTVASSRYVSPIKLRVDKLLKQLNLFNETLVKPYENHGHHMAYYTHGIRNLTCVYTVNIDVYF